MDVKEKQKVRKLCKLAYDLRDEGLTWEEVEAKLDSLEAKYKATRC